MNTKDLLLKLTSIHGPSGFENQVIKEIQKIMEEYSDECHITKLGSLICLKKGNGKGRIGLLAHVDQLGFVVSKIDEKGFAYVEKIGGWDPKVVAGQRAIIYSNGKIFNGVFGFLAPHLQKSKDRKIMPNFDGLFLDISMNKKWKEINVGDIVMLDDIKGFETQNFVFAPALDNRASCTSIILTAKMLQKMNHSFDVFFIFTTQEEIGGPGAPTSAYFSELDYAFVIDVTHGDEKIPGYAKIELNKGPAVGFGPVIDREFNEKVRKVAEKYNIKTQLEPIPRNSGTDTDEVQLVRTGIKTQLLSIPLKYMHTPYEKVSITDVENTAKLMAFTIIEMEVQ
ncbi:M20/M25/M40 family metallo-hydrolase [Thermosipho atlanticus]|uniref:Endoglucanase n=1 Tax=Thermosipho atlanticus DSM 15807 TaxID=1123380 RepID=A0A1M5S299_9BACT|nr:M20/M25/M40 family metallo-hydrolase [Thermosipho atlanticus]SHH32782.1 endoglucanase [Thermosipho atlanticus DSM 15807]